jgi:periplasmic protein TonB
MFKDWNNVTMDERNDIVFAGRNQAYGAYEIRTTYNRRVSFIVGGMIVFSILLLVAKKIIDRPQDEAPQEVLKVEQIDLTPPPPIEEQPPPPPPPPPPPMVEMVKFVPPVIKDEAVEEEPQKTIEEVKDVQVGVKDQEGEDIVAPPAEVTGPAEPAAPEVFTIVEEMPEPEGGMGAFYSYLQKNIQYPAMAREANISGKCFLRFVVNESGQISDVQVQKGVPGCPECDREAVRVLKSYPKWKVGKQNGRPVKVFLSLPISFKIQ